MCLVLSLAPHVPHWKLLRSPASLPSSVPVYPSVLGEGIFALTAVFNDVADETVNTGDPLTSFISAQCGQYGCSVCADLSYVYWFSA